MIWGPILAWYLFLAGLSAGAYATVAYANLKKPDETLRFQSGGRILAPLAIVAGLLLLIVDAEAGFHNPIRFFFLLTNWSSVMTWGSAILLLFTLLACVSALLVVLKKKVPKALDCIGIFLSLCTAAYTGILIGVVETYPLWNSSLLPVLFTVSGFSAGLAVTFLLSTFFAPQEAEKLVSLRKLHYALPIIEGLLIAMLLFITAQSNPAGAASVKLLVSGELALLFWLGMVIIGLLAPILIGSLELFVLKRKSNEGDGDNAVIKVIGNTSTLIGGFLLRYLILVAAVPLTFLV